MHQKMRFTPFINYYNTYIILLQSKIILGHMNSIGWNSSIQYFRSGHYFLDIQYIPSYISELSSDIISTIWGCLIWLLQVMDYPTVVINDWNLAKTLFNKEEFCGRQRYWVAQKLPQICTVILRICIGKVAWFAV